MRQIIVLLLIGCSASSALCETTDQRLTFQPSTYANVREVLTRAAPTARPEITATRTLSIDERSTACGALV
jgi:hypothetical protein